MTRQIVKTFFLAAISASLAACGGTPNCDDGDVLGALKKQIMEVAVSEAKGGAAYVALNNGGYRRPLSNEVAYQRLAELAQSNPKAKTELERIDKEVGQSMKKINLDFSNIRPVSVDDKVKKTHCTADAKISGEGLSDESNLSYSAQKTNDGLIVEFGNN